MKVFFISGSDTNVGKTFLASNLTQALQAQGRLALCIKPIETGVGSGHTDAMVHLRDAQKLFPSLPYSWINLYAFPLPASPFVADTQGEIELERIFSHIAAFEVDILLIEGAGGLFVPIQREYFMLDFALELQERFGSKVIFVCDDGLGMINRILSAREILQNRALEHLFFINIKNQAHFEQINLPFLRAIGLEYESSIQRLIQKL